MQQARMEFINGYGWRWPDGTRVYQEQQLIPHSVLPIGYADYGRPEPASDLRVESGSAGFWVMDKYGSLHRHPFQTESAALAYLAELK